jgi:hypothetical protein
MEDRVASRDMDHEAKTELMSIVDGLSPKGRASIASLREDQVSKLHFGFGLYIRNQIRQGRLQALFRWSRRKYRSTSRTWTMSRFRSLSRFGDW